MKLGITGAGGQLGTALVRHAMARTAAANIVGITRNPAKLDAYGIEARAGDFSAPATLAAAFNGIDRLVIIPTADLQPGVRIQQHTAAIDAAIKAGTKHIIYISTVSPRPDPSNVLLDSHYATEQALMNSAASATGVTWTLLRMSVYMDSLVDAAKRGVAAGTYSAVPGSPAAYVTRDDIAAAAAGLLTATTGHAGITYHATGPISITQQEVASIIAEATGKEIAFGEMTADQQKAGLEAAGLPPFIVTAIAGFGAAIRAGAFDLVTGDVARLAGKAPESPLQFFKRILAN